MLEATIHRPVTPRRLAAVLGWKTFQVLAVLTMRETFLAPTQSMDEAKARTIAEDVGVTLHIMDEDGSDDIPPSSPVPCPPGWDDEFTQQLENKIAASVLQLFWRPLNRLEVPPVTWRQPAGPDPDTLSPE